MIWMVQEEVDGPVSKADEVGKPSEDKCLGLYDLNPGGI